MKRSTLSALVILLAGVGPAAGARADDDGGAEARSETLRSPALGAVAVRLDGHIIGDYIGRIDGLVALDLPAAAPEPGTVLVSQAASLWNAPLLEVLSPTGYTFHIATSDADLPWLGEGELERAFALYYDSPSCGGQAYLPVQSESGRFSAWALGDGRLRPIKRWVARQGIVFGSPDPADPTQVYMLRRGAAVEHVFLQSLKVITLNASPPAATCFTPPFTPELDAAVRAEPLESDVAGVAGPLGGAITLGR
jgi:hypothetical protein